MIYVSYTFDIPLPDKRYLLIILVFFYISMGDIFRFRCLMFLSALHPKSRWPINEKPILNYDVYCIWATVRSQPHQRTTSRRPHQRTTSRRPHQRTTSQRRFVLWNHNIVLLSNYLLFSTSPCASVWRFVYGAHHATDHIVSKFITDTAVSVLLRHRNVAAIRTVQTVLLTAPSTEATCMRNMPAFCNVPVPLMTVSSLVYLTNDTKFFTVL